MSRQPDQIASKSTSNWMLVFAAGGGVLVFAWWSTWFLCDDAFIAFRYVGNAYDGHGLVWNAAPFLPVEGYSCFSWVVLLWLVWSITGQPPPVTANWLALSFALASLWLVTRFLHNRGKPLCSRSLALLALIGSATNLTFATWASSGLETAMFGCFAIGWTLTAFARGRLFRLSAFAALAALTRPDGALLGLATAAVAVHALVGRRAAPGAVMRGVLPLVLPVLHVGWRRLYYGEWLPNTYYAKVVSAWPESGLRYLWCFVVEHGLWLWLPVIVGGITLALTRSGAWRRLWSDHFAAVVAVASWLFFVGYYSLVVGGDHFAWRPFAHLIPLLFAALALVAAPWRRQWLGLGVVVVFGVVGNTFGWCHDRALVGREKDGFVRADVVVGEWLAPMFRGWERDRAWMRLHYVGLPRRLHDATCRDLLELLPSRQPGRVVGLGTRRGVYRTVAAGVVGWSLPDVAIIDAVGLNDWVVARHESPPPRVAIDPAALGGAFELFDADRSARLDHDEIGELAERLTLGDVAGVLVSRSTWGDLLLALCDTDGDGLDEGEFRVAVDELRDTRHMAHERTPPAGYIEALRPNVKLEGGRFVVVEGVQALTDSQVRSTEQEYRAR